jgi:hypothetical protein
VEWIDHVTNFGSFLLLLFAAWQGWRNGRALREVKHATNSLMDARIVVERKEAVLSERASAAAAGGVPK